MGPPFSRGFERYIDGQRPMTPIRQALFAMRPPKRRPWPLRLRILWAIIEDGHSDPDALSGIMRISRFRFDPVALLALKELRLDTRLVERAA